jgi:hypothetical protein
VLQDLKDHFGQVGSVRHADVLQEGGPGSRSKGCGIVEVRGGKGRAGQCAAVPVCSVQRQAA